MKFISNISIIDLAYIAGFLDGDGSIVAQLVAKHDAKWGFQIRVTVQFTQKSSRSVYLLKLRDTIGAGYIRTIKSTQVSHYVITDVKCVYALLKALQPYLKIKQKQADLIIRLIELMPLAKNSQEKFIELAYIVDQVASLNDSKTRKHTAAVVVAHLKNKSS